MHERHMTCFQQTLNGWNKQSPQKRHTRQYSLLHQLQDNLARYEDESNRLTKSKSIPVSKLDVEKVRLPLLTNIKSNTNLQNNQNLQTDKALKEVRDNKSCELQFCLKNVKKPIPLRMKTLVIYQRNENDVQDGRLSKIKRKKERRNICQNIEKQKYRKKAVLNFERIRQIGINLAQFSDQRFFKDMTCIQQKTSRVKLYRMLK